MRSVKQNPAAPTHRLLGKREKTIAGNGRVRYLYAPGEAENDTDVVPRTPCGLLKLFLLTKLRS